MVGFPLVSHKGIALRSCQDISTMDRNNLNEAVMVTVDCGRRAL